MSRRILLVSLALNLFFVGAWAALAWRHHFGPPHGGAGGSPATRIERLAAGLPAADAEKLRSEMRARAGKLDAATGAFRRAQMHVREALRGEPFNPDVLRSAMADARAARLAVDEAIQDVIAAASAQMAPEGRRKLADWTPYRRSGNEKSR
jgi:uncharacterized membrane protein